MKKKHNIFIMMILVLSFFKCYDAMLEEDRLEFATASKKEVENFLSKTKLKSSTNYILDVNVDQLKKEAITNSSQELTVVPVKTKDSAYYSRLVFLKIDGEIEAKIVHFHAQNTKTTNLSGEIIFTDLEGSVYGFGYYKNGLLTHLSKDLEYNKKTDDNYECRQVCGHTKDDQDCICNTQELNGFSIVVPQPYVSITTIYPQDLDGDPNCENDCNGWNPGPGTGTGNTNNSNNEASNCGENSEPSKDGKSCNCKEGYTKNASGTCIKKPCVGNPIIGEVQIASQKGKSGTIGALFGNLNNGGCVRYGGSDCTGDRNKKHDGIDLESSYGNPIYAMYDGFIYSTKYDSEGAGYYTRIQSTVNGETILISYFHLQKENRILQQSNPLRYVKAGDIIGYQGDSGNLKNAISEGTVDSHLHIEVRKHNGGNNWGYNSYELVDPRDYLKTEIDEKGNTVLNSNCN
ncbi:MAG: hypothetical protein CMB99_09685 [Flavobacteriaceae bacterium]|nr:hypothetical protein [Flavobacteriaceae bacterium]|tara:strand:+ start:398482 stop:399861 length:1380 start_codon:yes stop_codon:yes gene_type:complete